MQVARKGLTLVLALAMSLAAAAAFAQAPAGGKRVALLVGIGTYQRPEAAPSLEGPLNDVASMKSVLMRRMGVREADIEVLQDQQATRAGMLRALQRLEARSGRGDQLIFYFSGHGSSRLSDDPEGNAAIVPYGSGAIIAHDFNPQDRANGMIVGRTDLQPLIRRMEDGGRSLFVIFDSCFSGNAVRSLNRFGRRDELPRRFIPADFAAEGTQVLKQDRPRQAAPPYPYSSTVFIGAASEGEYARDVTSEFLQRFPTIDRKPHGAFTDALLRVLEGEVFADYDGNGQVDYAELSAAVQSFMSGRGYGHTPQRLPTVFEDTRRLASRSVVAAGGRPAGAAVAAAKLVVAAEGVSRDVTRELESLGGFQLVGRDHASPDVRLMPDSANVRTLHVLTAAYDEIFSFTPDTPPREWMGRLSQLSWHKQVRTLGEQGRRGLLKAEIKPNEFGGNFRDREVLWFVVRPENAARVLLLNTDSLGKVSVLYPYKPADNVLVPAGQPFTLPPDANGLEAQPPYGMDMQLIFAFEQDYPELNQLAGATMQPGDARLRLIEQLLTKASGRYTMALTELRVLPQPRK